MTLTITNTSGGSLSLDYTFDERRSIRALLPKDGTFDASNAATLDELHRNAQFSADLAAGRVSLTVDADDSSPLPDAPSDVLDSDNGLFQPYTFELAFAAGAGGAADDVTLLEDVPFACKVVDAFVKVATGNGTDTLTLRDTAGGGGTALSSAMNMGGSDTLSRSALGSSPALAAGDTIYGRRSDSAIAGTVYLTVVRTAV